jgi:arylsulfatase A-like enzyme
MTQLALERARPVTRLGIGKRDAPSLPVKEVVALGGLTVLGLAVTLGLVTGLVELVMHLVRRRFINPSSLGSLQLNSQACWMVPISDLLIFGSCGLLVTAAAALGRSRRVHVVGVFGLFFLSAFAVLLTFRGLTSLACTIFATGVAFRLTVRLLARAGRPARVVRWSLPAVVALVALLSLTSLGREKLGEHLLVQARSGSPNVLYIVLDTVRAESLSLYGYHRETSPNLTKLARRGVRFDQARTAAAWTLPSHASMFTGRWPYELSTRPDRPLDAAYPTLAEVLRDHGYATAGFVGNTYFCNRWFGLDRGFVHYEDVAPCLVEIIRSSDMGRALITKLAPSIFTRDRPYAYFNRKDAATINHDLLGWLSGRPKGQPFFAFLNYYDAHDPYIAAEGAPRHFGLRPKTASEVAALRDWLHVDKTKLPGEVLQMAIDGYDDGIAYLDDQLGRLFGALDSRGLLENTLIVITADHGELHGEHNGFGHGSHLYRQVVDVPLVVVGPRNVPKGKTVVQPVSLRDLPSTVVDLLGLPSSFPGRSLARYFNGSPASASLDGEYLLTETSDEVSKTPIDSTRSRSLLHEGKVYIRNSNGTEELFDQAADPVELHDLSKASDFQLVLARFREKMKQIDHEAVVAERHRLTARQSGENGRASLEVTSSGRAGSSRHAGVSPLEEAD